MASWEAPSTFFAVGVGVAVVIVAGSYWWAAGLVIHSCCMCCTKLADVEGLGFRVMHGRRFRVVEGLSVKVVELAYVECGNEVL